ncbi:hypothetical protein EVG20_g5061 [Dentipellis fragilis]|uniref:BTB domain-containing protein n=1 Tax=Dentipellis fragilis TaxID=205917 RepID=A0A4Y9YWC6_9AGAM|nr:hypothetical protein EVG20_g5061 [Dentipellis fragilis]
MTNAPTIIRNNRYYFQDGSDIFQVENQLFKVHRFFLQRYSSVFRDILSQTQPHSTGTTGVKGTSDANPIRIPQVTTYEFETLMDSFYFTTLYDEASLLVTTPAGCFALLRVTHRFKIISDKMQELAIDALNRCQPPVDDVELLAVAAKCNVQIAYLIPALERLATRSSSLTGEEMERLPKDMLPKICKAREEIYKQRICQAQSVEVPSSPQKIVHEVFGVPCISFPSFKFVFSPTWAVKQ